MFTDHRVLLGVAVLTTAAFVLWLTGNAALTRRGRLVALCERQWTTQRAMAIIAALDTWSVVATAAPLDAAQLVDAVLSDISEARRVRAEPSMTRAATFIVDRAALRSLLTAERAVAPCSDEKQLRWLWTVLVPSVPYSRRSEQWGRLGFQGTDPSTDFRSMAGVALADLLHVVREQRELCARLVDEWSLGLSIPGSPPPSSLPLALTSINASAWLWSLFEQGMLDRCLLVRGATLASYRDLFVEIFVGFSDEWTQKAPESVMAFEEVAAPFVERIHERLRRGGEQLFPEANGAHHARGLKHGKDA